MKTFIAAAKAISDPTRVKIIKLLQVKELCVCEIHAALSFSQPTISNHLKILENARIVTSRKERNWVIYTLNGGAPEKTVRQLLATVTAHLDEDPEIQELCRKITTINRTNICEKK